MLDLKITGATIIDGSGKPGFRGDIGIRDGRIAAIGDVSEAASEKIDASGLVVSPGFIDVHTHYDAQAFWDPTLSPSSFHGVTTIFGGFCGFSIAPLTPDAAAYLLPMLARVEGMPIASLQEGVPWDWTSYSEFLGKLEGRLAINAGFLAGHSAIRRCVMGSRAVGEKATPAEIEDMRVLLRESIAGGAMGFSTTISPTHNDGDGNPVPSRHASREEILALASVVSEFEGTCAELLPSLAFPDGTYELMTDFSLAAQRPVNWNVLTINTTRPDELARVDKMLKAGDHARAHGAEVVALTIPRTPTVRVNFESGFIFDSISGWTELFRLPIAERIGKLSSPAYRAELRAGAASEQGIMKPFTEWANYVVSEIFSDANKGSEGRSVGDIAGERGGDVFDTFLDITVADDLRTSFLAPIEPETRELYEARARLWRDSRTIVGASDAGAHLDMIDTFALATNLLEQGVREYGVISIEEAVYQLTAKPARLFGLRERGEIKEGWHADLVIFSPDKVACGPVHTRNDLPGGCGRLYADARGIHHVIVNGCEIIRDGKYLGKAAGKIIRPGTDTDTVEIGASAKSREPEPALTA